MPRRPGFSEDVRRLVLAHVNSIGALDLLMMLRDDTERWWTVPEVSDALRCPPRWAAVHLEQMHTGGLLDAEGDSQPRYAFGPRDARLRAAVEDLAVAYSTRTGDVTKLIFSLTGPELQGLSDALRLRRDEED